MARLRVVSNYSQKLGVIVSMKILTKSTWYKVLIIKSWIGLLFSEISLIFLNAYNWLISFLTRKIKRKHLLKILNLN